MRAILNIGLQHHSFTSLSPIGPSSEKAFALTSIVRGARRWGSALKGWVPSQRCGLPGPGD